MVSDTLSPLAAEEESAEEKPSTLPPKLSIAASKEEVLEAGNIPYQETKALEEVMPELDILYMTRVQKERFFNEEDYIRLKDSFILDALKMQYARSDMLVLHPLPRVNEIATEVDDDPRAVYFSSSAFVSWYGIFPASSTSSRR